MLFANVRSMAIPPRHQAAIVKWAPHAHANSAGPRRQTQTQIFSIRPTGIKDSPNPGRAAEGKRGQSAGEGRKSSVRMSQENGEKKRRGALAQRPRRPVVCGPKRERGAKARRRGSAKTWRRGGGEGGTGDGEYGRTDRKKRGSAARLWAKRRGAAQNVASLWRGHWRRPGFNRRPS